MRAPRTLAVTLAGGASALPLAWQHLGAAESRLLERQLHPAVDRSSRHCRGLVIGPCTVIGTICLFGAIEVRVVVLAFALALGLFRPVCLGACCAGRRS